MKNATNLSELCNLIKDKLIEYGVQEHVAWQTYSSDYLPIVRYFNDHGETEFNLQLLDAYQDHIRERYDNGEYSRRTYLCRLRASARIAEFYNTGDLSHVCAGNYAKTRLYFRDEALLQEFLAWSEPVEAKTKADMEWSVRKYLLWTEKQGLADSLDSSAHVFSGYLTYASTRYAEGSLHNIQLYLKKFHRFLNEEKHMDIPYEFVLSLPIIRPKKVFRPLTAEEIRRTIDQIDRSTAKGKRDYAIVLLAARCGLRGIDIIRLKLTDIDWRGNEIRLVQDKTDEPLVLPLLPDIGEALKEYILNGRPDVHSEYVFLRAVHPYRPLTKTMALSHMWTSYQKKAGIDRYAQDGKGFHSLRRALGKAMNEAEIPATTAAQVLGHRSAESVKHYISLDTKHLKECAIDLTGIAVQEGGHPYGRS